MIAFDQARGYAADAADRHSGSGCRLNTQSRAPLALCCPFSRMPNGRARRRSRRSTSTRGIASFRSLSRARWVLLNSPFYPVSFFYPGRGCAVYTSQLNIKGKQ